MAEQYGLVEEVAKRGRYDLVNDDLSGRYGRPVPPGPFARARKTALDEIKASVWWDRQ